VPPRLFLHEFLKPRKDIKESFLVARTSWSHFQCANTSPLSWTNAWISSNFKSNNLFSPLFNHAPLYWSGFFAIFCRIQYLPILPGQFPTTLQAQSLLWDINLPPWLNWCLDMPCWIKLSSVQLLTKGKLHPWFLLQLPRRKEHPKEFLFRLESFPSWA
jgi:hypothetical protein